MPQPPAALSTPYPKPCGTVQSDLLRRAAFRMKIAVLLDQAAASAAVDDEHLATISRVMLDCLGCLDEGCAP